MKHGVDISRTHIHVGIAGLAFFAISCGEAAAGGFGIEQSAYYQGMSYAGAAAGGPSLSSISWNPATAGFAGNGLTMESSYSVILLDMGLTVLNPGAQPVTGPAETQMARNALVGASYATWRLDNKTVLGVSLTSPFGLGTKAENQNWVGSFEGVTTSLFNLNMAPIVSYEIVPGITVAAGLQIDYFNLQRQTAVTPFGSGNLRADDTGVGYVAGIDYAPSADTSIGLGFRSAIDHTLTGTVGIDGLADAPAKASIELPAMVSLGARQAISPTMRVLGEVEWVNWSQLGVIPVSVEAPLLGLPAGGTIANLDFRWRDGWLFALGGEYDWSSLLTLRAGANYEISPVDGPTTRLVQDPDSNRIWTSIGASYKWSADTRLDFSYSHVFFQNDAPFNRVTASTLFTTPPLVGTADVEMDVISVAWKTVWGGPAAVPVALK
jgi:long-chain fatty acid transport protein